MCAIVGTHRCVCVCKCVCACVSLNEKEKVGRENASFHVCGLKSTLTIRFDHSAVYSFIRAEKQEDLATLQPNVQKFISG